MLKKFFGILNTITALLFTCSCVEKNACYQCVSGEVWTTEFNIIYDSDLNFADSITSVLDRVGKCLSAFDEKSLVARVNGKSGVVVDEDFINVYKMSREIHRRSGGRFDPTLKPLISAWGFGAGHHATEDTSHIEDILNYVGIDKTHLNGNSLFKEDARIEFNFSGIAKGYGSDQVAAMFRRNGVSNFLIEIGGEIYVGGVNEKGEKWSISIDNPIQNESDAIHISLLVIEASDCGIATSGNYRNYRSESSYRYGHTISPVTGRPVQTDILSATIIASTAMEADGMATACLTMNSDSAMALCNAYSYPAMFVLSDSTMRCTPLFAELIR